MPPKRISALIAAYNEADRIETTIRSLGEIAGLIEVLVVDDGSVDATAVKARQAGAKVIRLPRNSGKGTALNQGAPYVKGDLVLLLDADLGETASEMKRLIPKVLSGQADMAVAAFMPRGAKGGFGLAKGVARKGLRYLSGLDLKEPLSGQRVLTREVWKQVLPLEKGFGVEIGLSIQAARLGCRVLEVPVAMRHREHGRSLHGFYHRGRQCWQISAVLLRQAVQKYK